MISKQSEWRAKSARDRRPRGLAACLFFPGNNRRERSPNGNDGASRRIVSGMSAREHFFLYVLHEILNLPLHLFHALAHLQDDRNAANVYPQVASQIENEFQPLQVLIGIKSRVSFGARGFQ